MKLNRMPPILKQKTSVKVTRSAIRRAVASSTAIETGQSVEVLERKLKSGRRDPRARLAVAKAG
jgi:hypothetical protein